MDRYAVKLLARASRDLDEIYAYIVQELLDPMAADRLISALEEGILSLGQFPQRGALRRVGSYANKGYRQLFVENYSIVYRVDVPGKQVVIVTVRYVNSQY